MFKVNRIYNGDCLEVTKDWPDNCIDLVFADYPFENGNSAQEAKRGQEKKREVVHPGHVERRRKVGEHDA